jgi:hypothetical protein
VGTDIDYTQVKTFRVLQFENKVPNAPANIHVQFTEALRDKVRNNTRLKQESTGGDIELSGEVNEYVITSVAPKPGENAPTSALQQLQIGVSVTYKNRKQQGKDWESKSFRYQVQFNTSDDFNAVQDRLIKDCFETILENTFNAAFSNW